MKVRQLQRRDVDGVWYDDAYAFKNRKGPVTFRYNLTWERAGDHVYGQIREQNIGLSEIEKVVPEGEYRRWLAIEEVEDEKAEAHLEMLDEICCIPLRSTLRETSFHWSIIHFRRISCQYR